MSFSDILAEAVLSTSSDAIIAADEEGIIRFWNPGAERIFGYSSGAAIGQCWTSSSRNDCVSAIGTATTTSSRVAAERERK
jgi:PAS domain S-box-containing protein